MHIWIRNNVVGLVALFVALSGTAVAAQVASNAGHAGVAKAAKKKVKRGPAGPQGAAGANGANGTNGTNGTAVAFAAVNSDGTLRSDIPGANFNITQAQVSKEGNGLYCFHIPGVRNAVANVSDLTNAHGVAVTDLDANGGTGSCGNTFTAEVQTSLAGADSDQAFFVLFQ